MSVNTITLPQIASPDTLTDVRDATVDNTWITQSVSTGVWEHITFSPELSLLVATSSSNQNLARSSDGITWVTFSETVGGGISYDGVVWSPERSEFLAINTGNAIISSDGITWSTFSGTDAPDSEIIWVSDLSIYAGTNGVYFVQSTDGITWTSSDTNLVSATGLTWSSKLRSFVISGQVGGAAGAFSFGSGAGVWTTTSVSTLQLFTDVEWSPTLELFVSVCDGNVISTSTTGTSWTTYTQTGVFRSITWASQVELFFAVGDTGLSLYSSTGLTGSWITVPGLGSTNLNDVVWTSNLQNFYIAGESDLQARSASDYSSLVQTSTYGTQGVTNLTIKGQDISIGQSASQITLGSPGVLVNILGTFMGASFIKDSKADTADGGTFTSGAWQTRDLNTLSNYGNIGCVLNSNQFTLSSGTYFIICSAPAFQVGRHQIRLQNITASTSEYGSSAFNGTGSGVQTNSVITGIIVTINSSSIFEIQHRCSTTKAGDGFGVDSGGLSSAESNFTMVSIYRLI